MFCQRDKYSPTFISKIFSIKFFLNLGMEKDIWLYVKTLRKKIHLQVRINVY